MAKQCTCEFAFVLVMWKTSWLQWFQEYPRPPNHGHLTSIEIHATQLLCERVNMSDELVSSEQQAHE